VNEQATLPLPGCAPVPAANRPALEQDLHSQVAICLMALFCWVEFHGGRTALIDDTIERFIAAGGTPDPQISRAIANTRSVLARYLASGSDVPAWLPESIVNLLNTSWCAADLAPLSDYKADTLRTETPAKQGKTETSATLSSPKSTRNAFFLPAT